MTMGMPKSKNGWIFAHVRLLWVKQGGSAEKFGSSTDVASWIHFHVLRWRRLHALIKRFALMADIYVGSSIV